MNNLPANNHVRKKYRSIFWLVGSIVLIGLVVLIGLSQFNVEQEYATFVRPDGNYRIVVIKKVGFGGRMPGQASDVPGYVRLYDRHNSLLHETRVDMVQLVEKVEWANKRVHIKLVADWELPD